MEIVQQTFHILNKSDVRYLIEDLDENYTSDSEWIYNQASKYHFLLDEPREVDKNVFFIWIGALDLRKMKYLNVWIKSYDNLHIWIDSRTILYSNTKAIVKNIQSKYKMTTIESQNYFYSKCQNLSTDSIIAFVEKEFPELLTILKSTYKVHSESFKSLSENYIIHDLVNTIKTLDPKLEKYYSYEVALRNNLAAASDILRLSVLYRHGGTYIDVDTLPDFRQAFKHTYQYGHDNNINLNLFDSYMSQIYFNLASDQTIEDIHQPERSILIEYIEGCLPDIQKYIDTDIRLCPEKKVKFNPPSALDNLICLSVNKNNYHEFNNNIISCKKQSKLVKIIIREMCRRYHYIESRNHHYLKGRKLINDNLINPHYERMCHYREDNEEIQDNLCTLVLSGPTLILEVLLGCTAEILNTQSRSVPIAAILRNITLGIAFEDQVMYTYEHLDSSWLGEDSI
jgi:mannosyltransferase OCH1-like enzyme